MRAKRAAHQADPSRPATAKLHVLGASQQARVGSMPLSKPYNPRRNPNEPPFNESEGGNAAPGRIA